MVEEKFTIKRPEGFHLKPAANLFETAKKFDCKTNIVYNEQTIEANNVIAIVAACIDCNSSFTVLCDGPEEKECLDAIKKLAKNNFDN